MDTSRLIELQLRTAGKVSLSDGFHLSEIEKVGGVDQAFVGDTVISALVVLEYPSLKKLYETTIEQEASFPYIPSFLSFREGPPAVEAYRRAQKGGWEVDVLLVDGCGVNHPRRAGLASHIGVELDLPTIGVSKSRLCEEYDDDAVPKEVGSSTAFSCSGTFSGYLYKSCKRCRPLYIAPGHMVTPETCLEVVSTCMSGSKLPEPLRVAHALAKSRQALLSLP